jgi:hypothetical protein
MEKAAAVSSTRRPALGLVLVFIVVLLSPMLFDLATPVLAR